MEGFCHRCGDCCENIVFEQTPQQMLDWLAENDTLESDNATSLMFVLENWTRRDDGRWSCQQLNQATRLCEAGDDRPPVCKGFPWYGNPPGAHKVLDKKCGYWYDIPVEQWQGVKLLPLV